MNLCRGSSADPRGDREGEGVQHEAARLGLPQHTEEAAAVDALPARLQDRPEAEHLVAAAAQHGRDDRLVVPELGLLADVAPALQVRLQLILAVRQPHVHQPQLRAIRRLELGRQRSEQLVRRVVVDDVVRAAVADERAKV